MIGKYGFEFYGVLPSIAAVPVPVPAIATRVTNYLNFDGSGAVETTATAATVTNIDNEMNNEILFEKILNENICCKWS